MSAARPANGSAPLALYRVSLWSEARGLTRQVTVPALSPAQAGRLASAQLQRQALRPDQEAQRPARTATPAAARPDWVVSEILRLASAKAPIADRLETVHGALRELAMQRRAGEAFPWDVAALECLASLAGDCRDEVLPLELDRHPVPAWERPDFLPAGQREGGA